MVENRALAKKISAVLSGLCPAFSDSDSQTAYWHGCRCAISDGHCVCVWHLTSDCNGGKWKELAFVDKAAKLKDKETARMLDAVMNARN